MNIDDNDDLIPADDDLTPVSDDQKSETQSADGFRLEPGSETGLKFEPSDNTGTYELSSGNEPLPEANDAIQGAPQNDAPAVEANVSADDVYGIVPADPPETKTVAPTRPVEPSRNADAVEEKKSGFSFKFHKKQTEEYDPALDEDVSVSTLRARREEQLMKEELDKTRIERTPLPARPFVDSILKPFASPGCVARLLMVAGAAFIPLLFATLFFTRTLSDQVALELEHDNVKALGAFLTCIWRDKVIFMLFCFLWGIFSVPISFQVFIDTASGSDEIEEWPEFNFLGGLLDFLWIFTLIVLAGIPGAAFFQFLGFNYVVGLTLSATILAPIFFLSCMQADARFTLLTKEVMISLKHNCKSWLILTGIYFAFLLGTVALSLAAIQSSIVTEEGAKVGFVHSMIVAAILSLAFSFIPALYLRFLGRLAWIVEDDARKREELKEEKEEEELDGEAE